MFFLLVSRYSLTLMNPRLSISTPVFSTSSKSALDLRPTAIRMCGAVNSFLLPVLPSLTATFILPPSCVTSSAWVLVNISIRWPSCSFSNSRISGSSIGIRLSIISRIVTLVPMAAKKCPNSTPIYPPPMIIRLSGSSLSCSSVSFVKYSTLSKPFMGGIKGREPEARKILSPLIVSPSTSIV